MSISIIDHPEKGYVEIEGIKYTHEFFRDLGMNGIAIGTVTQVVQREDGVVTLMRYDTRKADAVYDALGGILDGLDANTENECLGLTDKQWERRIAGGHKAIADYEGKETERSIHVNPNCQDSTRCRPHGESGSVDYEEEQA